MLLLIPLNSCLASWMQKLQVKQMSHKDSRIKLVNEVLNGIKVSGYMTILVLESLSLLNLWYDMNTL